MPLSSANIDSGVRHFKRECSNYVSELKKLNKMKKGTTSIFGNLFWIHFTLE